MTTEKFGIAEESTSESLVLRECQSGGAYRPIGLSTVLEMVLDILEPNRSGPEIRHIKRSYWAI